MLTKTPITIYHRRLSAQTDTVRYFSYPAAAHVQTTLTQGGGKKALVLIFVSDSPGYIEPDSWQPDCGGWTVAPQDKIFIGQGQARGAGEAVAAPPPGSLTVTEAKCFLGLSRGGHIEVHAYLDA